VTDNDCGDLSVLRKDIIMWHSSWEAFRAYLSPILVTVLALVGVWKDASDYRDLIKSDPVKGIKHFAKKNIVGILCFFTILIAILGFFDIHAARVTSREADTKSGD
jgi:flagellar biosynthesis protein FlhB